MNLEIFKTLDTDRISALCSSIPQRNDYNGKLIQDKLSFWSSILTENLVFTNEQLREITINGLKPLCLDDVLNHLVSAGKIRDRNQGWINYFWSKIASSGLESEKTWVVVEKLEEIVKSLEIKQHLLDKEDYDHLSSRNELESQIITEYLIYKFKQKEGLEITDTDVDIIKLQKTVKSIRKQIAEIEGQINKLEIEIKELLVQKKRQKAVYSLKKKKTLESVLERRLNSLATVENIVDKINEKTTELEILEAYSTGTVVLKEFLKKMDKAQDTVDDLQDILADHKEIEDVMNITTYDDVEEELEELLTQEELSNKKANTLDVEGLIKELDNLNTGPALPTPKEKEKENQPEKSALLA
ncbi:Charged multivesicular body protein 7 [Terramyces sp. JEL0728]|nr:Charged multivesicular body protein 7 [Terramyces sp. JEL0728]